MDAGTVTVTLRWLPIPGPKPWVWECEDGSTLERRRFATPEKAIAWLERRGGRMEAHDA
jgi:hypothetical protein